MTKKQEAKKIKKAIESLGPVGTGGKFPSVDLEPKPKSE